MMCTAGRTCRTSTRIRSPLCWFLGGGRCSARLRPTSGRRLRLLLDLRQRLHELLADLLNLTAQKTPDHAHVLADEHLEDVDALVDGQPALLGRESEHLLELLAISLSHSEAERDDVLLEPRHDVGE